MRLSPPRWMANRFALAVARPTMAPASAGSRLMNGLRRSPWSTRAPSRPGGCSRAAVACRLGSPLLAIGLDAGVDLGQPGRIGGALRLLLVLRRADGPRDVVIARLPSIIPGAGAGLHVAPQGEHDLAGVHAVVQVAPGERAERPVVALPGQDLAHQLGQGLGLGVVAVGRSPAASPRPAGTRPGSRRPSTACAR